MSKWNFHKASVSWTEGHALVNSDLWVTKKAEKISLVPSFFTDFGLGDFYPFPFGLKNNILGPTNKQKESKEFSKRP